jgi:hypothetical protein
MQVRHSVAGWNAATQLFNETGDDRRRPPLESWHYILRLRALSELPYHADPH